MRGAFASSSHRRYTLAMVRNAACILAAAVLVSVLAAACGGGGATKTVVRTVAAGPSTQPVITGDGSIDLVVDAALKADDIALAGLTGYEHVPCKKGPPEALGAAPACRENESDGASVEVLASSGCSNGWVRPEQAPDAYRISLAPDKPELVSVIKPRLGPFVYGGGFGAQSVAVFRSKIGGDGQPGGVALHITDGRISWIEASCHNLAELTAPARVESVIFDPKNAAASSSPTPSATAATPAAGTTPKPAQ
jgi:hypothetical protein